MKTGEGKTLTATLAVYLNALEKKGVHLVTVNDYLAKRDAEWMGKLYNALGLEVGFIQSNMDHLARKKAYEADVTYGTNNEFGFDYLRDNMVEFSYHQVQRGLNYAIVDEVDSILIDESRTPLIISGPSEQKTDAYKDANRIPLHLKDKIDFELDEKNKNVTLTEIGISKVEKILNIDNLYDPKNLDVVHYINQSLKAHNMFHRDVDYVVQNGEIIIVDEFTGRLMEGRRYSDGLHQAIEAKEKVAVKSENQTLASITFQNFFRMYKKLSGMTGTADTEAEEFKKIYNLDVNVLPTHKPMVRKDYSDRIYLTLKEKINAIAEDIQNCYKKGQPVLVGTVSIESSETISKELKKRGVHHSVLNAKYHEKEAEIIGNAGQKKSITIATNMAGRGTDIILGEGVKQLGGLVIIGSERHESRRIDNQLRGRSGRQGDLGESRFYLSMEDDLLRIFMSEKISPLLARMGMEEGDAIEHKMITQAIARAQKRVESHNFDIRKHLLEYDDVMNKQRQFFYSLRNRVLNEENISDIVRSFITDIAEEKTEAILQEYKQEDIEKNSINWLETALGVSFGISNDDLFSKNDQELQKLISEKIEEKYQEKKNEIESKVFSAVEKAVVLQVVDQKWKEHLYAIDHLREGIWTMGYAERNPLVEYRFQSFQIFQDMVSVMKEETMEFLLKIQLSKEFDIKEEDQQEQYAEHGIAVHQSMDGYSVGNAMKQTVEKSVDPFSQSNPNRVPRASNLPIKTAGGSTKRKSSRRKRI